MQSALLLPIPLTIRSTAQQFALEQPTLEKAEQVRLNTIAVSVVNDYLQMLGVKTNLANSDSQNPVLRLCADVADLDIPKIGRLECRPIKTSDHFCVIPPEVWHSRIGYVIVQINQDHTEAKLLGFTPTALEETLSISDLQPIEEIFTHLHQLQNTATPQTNLSHWFNHLFDAGWEAYQTLFNSHHVTPAFNFRGGALAELQSSQWRSIIEIRRGKLITFSHQTIVLVINLKAISEDRVEINVQVYPTEFELYLPLGLQLMICDQADHLFMEAQARQADNGIQLIFTGEIGEYFKIMLTLGHHSFIEHFVI
ncbi:DUF1822 family protein [Chroococcus sp. FPU101]|uniref:DUF1822 family protein n=1 Tax=Chroococcus sp. FPU101 TaxID=1974212 RepID=UPI001A8DA262|nr:DUF1822 family protein [Chroococcus sp. FPU101]GFE69292.1 hypothetical protein CFPU101_19020 [Chroococcus sp. FPU101]